MVAVSEHPPRTSRRGPALCVLGAIILIVLVYIPALQGGFIWDDDDYVVDNWTLRSLDGLRAIWLDPRATPQYYPLVYTSFWVEYQMWGLRPFGFHVTNVLLHAASALLFWRVLRALNVPGAYLAALVFAMHPVHVESVAWITERKNVLSSVFCLGAALTYLRFCQGPVYASDTAARANVAGRWTWYGGAFVLFLCALLSKTVTATWPAAMVLVLWWRFGRIPVRDTIRLAPFFAVGIAMGLVTVWLEIHHVRAEGAEWDLTFLQRCLLAGRIPWFYLAKLLWPTNLCFIYPRWQLDEHVWWQYLFPTALLALATVLWLLRRRIGRGPLLACLLFCGTLFPVLGFFNVYPMRFSFVADHFQYHASLGVIAAAGAALHIVFRWLSKHRQTVVSPREPSRTPGILPTAASAAIVFVLAVGTWRQAGNYRSLEALWRATLAENPMAWIAHTNLGLVLVGQGRMSEALAVLDEARSMEPENAEVRLACGFAFLRAGRLAEAYEEVSRAVELRPASARAHALLGAVQARRSKIPDAIAHYREALRLSPDALEARSEFAFLLWNEGHTREAIGEYHALLTRDPHNADAMLQLAQALRTVGRNAEANDWLQRAMQLKPELADTIRHNKR